MNIVWKQAFRQAVSSACAVVITNMVDSPTPMFSWPWFRHMLIGMFFLTLLNEARYWKQWADGPDDTNGPNPQGGAMKGGIPGRAIGMLAVVVLLAMSCVGCNPTQSVETALGVVGNVISLAQDDLPSLQVAGVLTAGDVTAAGNWLTGASTLVGQGETCVNVAGGTTAKISACVSAIGAGLLSPTEQANLRIISPGAQKKVTLYVTAVVLAVNFAASIVKGDTGDAAASRHGADRGRSTDARGSSRARDADPSLAGVRVLTCRLPRRQRRRQARRKKSFRPRYRLRDF